MNEFKKDIAGMMSQVTDAYHQLSVLAAQTEPEKLQRALERTASQTERAALGVRKLCEKHSPGRRIWKQAGAAPDGDCGLCGDPGLRLAPHPAEHPAAPLSLSDLQLAQRYHSAAFG